MFGGSQLSLAFQRETSAPSVRFICSSLRCERICLKVVFTFYIHACILYTMLVLLKDKHKIIIPNTQIHAERQ